MALPMIRAMMAMPTSNSINVNPRRLIHHQGHPRGHSPLGDDSPRSARLTLLQLPRLDVVGGAFGLVLALGYDVGAVGVRLAGALADQRLAPGVEPLLGHDL